jgi:hypothetical protein
VAAVSRRSRAGRRRAEEGTSLVELLVVLALLTSMVLVASELVAQSMRLLGTVGRSVRNPLVVHVTGRLRNDVQAAFAVVEPDEPWSDSPLVLRTRDNRLLEFDVVDRILVRRTTTLDELLIEERALLRGVTSWWWRSPHPGVVDLRFAYLVNPGSEHAFNPASRYAGERRTETLRFAIRGAGGGARW